MRRGRTLIELLAAVAIFALAMALFLPGMLGIWRIQALSYGAPTVDNDARRMVLRLADALRAATLCTASDSGCTVDAAAENASATALTAYRRNDDGTLKKLTYAVIGGDFQQQTNGGVATTINTGATLAMVFYTGSSYNPSSLTTFTPTNATLKSLAAVRIQAQVVRNGLTSSYTTTVRLRNSPRP